MNKFKSEFKCGLINAGLRNICYVCVCLVFFSSCSTMLKNKAFKAVADGMAPFQ